MMEPHAQARLFDLPTTEQVAATLTQTKGLPLPPALGAEIMKSPQMGLSRRVTFTGSGTLEAFGWDRGTLTYRLVVEAAEFELPADLRMVDTETRV